ncbi:hypothetical protein MNEG_10720 [Monoraphidium neglectum]|uniref:Uncharacterized protein n=1 Tax=Monoraphidium neglectum TaxID=145388 RepID=A0A0D2KNN2_9CHLO|nr:hypothetical protein MNEG_10720 [Monoraphidium neglectum]KIY97243.1 hypothetical protein MNEG_10720 [Monoraphidium neglectum]|eukprot:XP_013896263.1 hypothetical protein MNEG_10720 [Monoraphidium neglectum]
MPAAALGAPPASGEAWHWQPQGGEQAHDEQQQHARGSSTGAAGAAGRDLMRRTASSPALRAACANTGAARASAGAACPACGPECACLEVFVVSRAFTEFGGPLFKRMTPEMKKSLVDLGICHYMTVFKTPDGRYVQFDFGPRGGDVEKANGPLAALLRAARLQQQQQQPQLALAGGPGGMRASASAPALELSAAFALACEGSGAGEGGACGGGACNGGGAGTGQAVDA